jgi:hypothetical protein
MRGISIPVDASQSSILTERGVVLIRLLPDLLALLHIVRRVNRIIDADNHDQSPGEGYEDPVGIQRAGAVGLAFSKGIEGGHGDYSQGEAMEKKAKAEEGLDIWDGLVTCRPMARSSRNPVCSNEVKFRAGDDVILFGSTAYLVHVLQSGAII